MCNMTLAACAKDVKFYRWPNICYLGIYETPVDCMTVKSISWPCSEREVLVVKSKGSPVIITPPTKPEQYIESNECIHINSVSVGTFSNTNPNLIGFGTDNGSVHIYNTKSKRFSHDFRKLPSAIQNLEFSSDDQCIAAGCVNGQIILYDEKFKPSVSFMIPNSLTLSTIAYSKYTPNLLAAASKEGVLALWDTETTDNIFCTKNHENRITDVAFFGNILSTVGIDGNFVSYDLRSGNCSSNYELDCPLSSLSYLINTYELAVSTTTGQLRSYDSRNMKNPLRTIVAYSSGSIKKIAFSNIRDETLISPTTVYHKHTTNYSKKCYEDNFSASGDFSIITDSSVRLSHIPDHHEHLEPIKDEDDDASTSIQTTACHTKSGCPDMQELRKEIEDNIKLSTKEFEEKLLHTFYFLRINTSKQFIGLEEKISQSWSSFVDYLRLSGATTSCNDMTKTSKDEDYLTRMDNCDGVAGEKI